MTLSGSSSLANYQTAIRAINFNTTSTNTGTRTIDVVVNDGLANSNIASTTVSILGSGGRPVIDLDANDSSGATFTGYLGSYTENGAAVQIADADTLITDSNSTNMNNAVITLTNAKTGDVLSWGTMPAGITASLAGNVVTLTGSATKANYQTAINAIRFSNTTENPDTTPRVIQVVVYDGAIGAANASNTAIATINVVAVNDAPINSLPASYTTNEDTSVKLSGLSVTDVDAASGTMTVTLGVASGTITAATAGSVTVTGSGTSSVQLSGTLANINAYLANATNQPTYVPVANANGTVTLTMTTNDGGNTGTGGALADVDIININITAVNDAPVNTLPASYTTNEDTSVKLSGLSVADVDAASGTMTVTLGVASGTITAASAGGVTITGSGTGSVVLSGTLANINAYLANVTNQPTYVPVANANGVVTLTMTTNDGGNTGIGGPLTDVDTRTINIAAVNDAPVLDLDGNNNTASGTSYNTFFSTVTRPSVAIADTDVSVTDIDSVNVVGATITLTNFKTGDSFSVGSLPPGITASIVGNVVTLSGSTFKTDYQAALHAVTFNSTSSDLTQRIVTVTVNDGLVDSNVATTTINMVASNTAPVANDVTAAGTEDTLVTVTLSGTDADGSVSSFKLTSLPTNGALYLDAAMTTLAPIGTSIAATGSGPYTATLYFKPLADWNGSTNFSYTAIDNLGAEDLTPGVATISVATVDDGTTVAHNDSFTLPTGTPYIISKATLLGNDALYDRATITSVSTPTSGTLVDNGNGTYTYTPSGPGTPTFTYTVTEDTGQASTATVTLNVVAAGDDFATVQESALPTGTGGGTTIASGNLFANDGGLNTSIANIKLGASTITDGSGLDTDARAGYIGVNDGSGTLVVHTAAGTGAGDYTYTLNSAATNAAPGGATDTFIVKDFTYTGNATTAALHVTIQDDKPKATDAIVSVPESITPSFSLVLVLDVSDSMGAPYGEVKHVNADGSVTTTDRYTMAKAALVSLVQEYFNQSPDVSVKLIYFSATATTVGGGTGTAYTDVTSAINAINGIPAPGGGTNYSDALTQAQAAMGTPSASRSNVVYFLSDGVPSAGNQTDPVGAGSGYSTYLTTNATTLKSYAVGIGTGIASVGFLDQINNVDLLGDGVADPAIMVPDLNLLSQQLLSTVPVGAGGNVVAGVGSQTTSFGADGGFVKNIVISLDSNADGVPDTPVTFTYSPGANTVTSSNTSLAPSVTGNMLTLNAGNKFVYGSLVFDFKTGDYTYFTGNSAHKGDSFTLQSTVSDNDGDLASSVQTISVIDGKPVANDDTDTLSARSTYLEGNVVTGVGTDAGIALGSQVTPFTVQASGVDTIVDNATVTSIDFKGLAGIPLNANVGSTALAGGTYSVVYNATTKLGVLTWDNPTTGSHLIFDSTGYYKYTPPTADVPNLSTSPTDLTVSFAGGGTSFVAFTSSGALAGTGVSLSAVDVNGTTTYTQAQLAYNTTSGVGLNSSSTGSDSTTRFDMGEKLIVNFSTGTFSQGVSDPSFAINVNTAGNLVYNVYNTSGALIGGPTTVAAAATLNLTGYSNVGSVSIQATTSVIRVTNVTCTDATWVDPTIAAGLSLSGMSPTSSTANAAVTYSATGAGVTGTGATGGGNSTVDGLEWLKIAFNQATYAQGVENLSFVINAGASNLGPPGGGTDPALTYKLYGVDGSYLGQFSSDQENTVTVPSTYSGIGSVVIEAAGDAYASIQSVTFSGVQNNAAATAIPAETLGYTLTDSNGDQSSATLTMNIITNNYYGDSSDNTITGTSGNDHIVGLGGNDVLSGGLGNDVIEGGDGNDTIHGDDGNDVLVGGAGNDLIYGDAGNDILRGGDGNDTLYGGSGDNRLEGGAGNDVLVGGDGTASNHNILIGGAGNDTMTGGGLLSDTFQWSLADTGGKGTPAVDTITDFKTAAQASGGDVLDLRDLLSGENHATGTGNLANFLHFERSGGDTKVHISSSGGFGGGFTTGAEDQTVVLQGVDLYAAVGVNATDQQVIQDLLTKGKLITD